MSDEKDGFDFDLTMSPMVARSMLYFARLMEKQQPGKWGPYIELYESLLDALGAPVQRLPSTGHDGQKSDPDGSTATGGGLQERLGPNDGN